MALESPGGLLEAEGQREAPFFSSTAHRGALLLVSSLLAAAGQYVFGRRLDDDLPLAPIASHLSRIFPNEEAALAAILLLVAAGLVFSLAFRRSGPVEAKQLEGPLRPQDGVVVEHRSLLLVVSAACLFAALNLLLLDGRYERWYVGLFFLVLILLGVVCLRQDRLRGVSLRFEIAWWEIATVAAIAIGFAGLNARDLDNWRYSAIGDEYAFYGLARDVANGYDLNVFSADEGVYRQHPAASAAYQAVFLKVLGENNFNWKLSGLVSIVLTLPFLYLLTRELFDRTVALIASVLFASSHYLFAYSHIGYYNILPIFPAVAAFCCFIYGIRRDSSLLMLLAGAFAGMGFYTFFSARSAIVVMALWFLTLPGWHRRWGASLPVSAGFIATATPIFAVSKLYVIEEMLRQSAFSYDDSVVGSSRWERVIENIPRTAAGFNYSTARIHFVSGSLADAVTAALFVVGLVFALMRLRDWRCRFVVLWLVLGFVAAGLLSPYPEVPVTRMIYLVPVVAVLAALGLTGFLRGLSSVMPAAY